MAGFGPLPLFGKTNMIHSEPHPSAGTSVPVSLANTHPQFGDIAEISIEDWWDRAAGKSWMDCNGTPACLVYAMRTGFSKRDIPTDNEVVYGHFKGMGVLLHQSELS